MLDINVYVLVFKIESKIFLRILNGDVREFVRIVLVVGLSLVRL